MNAQSESDGIRHIAIAGGGTSGWMTAAMLARTIPRDLCRITVIEPPGPRGIGVGEASIPSLVSLLKRFQADEAGMMRTCEGTYKLAIRFLDWIDAGSDHWHPFGVCGARIDGRDLFPWWIAQKQRGHTVLPYHEYSLHYHACLHGRGPHFSHGASPITETQSYAFHFNAEALAGWLRQVALEAGVREVHGAVESAVRNDSGDVTMARVTQGQTVSADFFIDCSGFRSILMHETLQDEFQSWNQNLLCDRAVAWKIPGGSRIPPFTVSKALQAGWMWQIPLTEHTGLGYVYSSQFISEETAWQQFQQAVPELDLSKATPRFLKMRVGRQTSFWKHNVLAVGLSAGFLEPLESTGIHLSQVGIELFLQLFSLHGSISAGRDYYNSAMAKLYDDVRDFVQMHYWLSQREDTPFWVAARNARLSATLTQRLQLYDETGMFDVLQREAFPDTSYYHILAGSRRLPKQAPLFAMAASAEMIQHVLNSIAAQNQNALTQLAPHESARGIQARRSA
ncbi:MAG: tryptophan halogenase family protein [Planctomycetaceae bacterium]